LKLGRLHIPVGVAVWFGVLGAPLAWTLMFVFGMGMTLAACNPGGGPWGIPVETWTIIATALAAAVALLALATSIAIFRDTREPGEEWNRLTMIEEDAPPEGRVHFLATIGIAISPLFFFIIMMSGLGAINLVACRQS
jgi:hypothetical protein